MAKRNRSVKDLATIRALKFGKECARASLAKYDPAIMDELLHNSKIREMNPELDTMDEHSLELFKGMTVTSGAYAQYLKLREQYLAGGGVIEQSENRGE